MKLISRILTLCSLLIVGSIAQEAPPTPQPAPEKTQAEDLPIHQVLEPGIVALFESLPVQDSGRVKPFDTVARFRLLKYHGKQSIRVDKEKFGKAKLSAVEWALVTWFKPELAKDLPVFVVDNSDAIIVLGLKAKGQRDRYSYNEIFPGREALMAKMQEVRQIEAKNRTPVQRTLGKLSLDFLDYEMMLNHFNFARAPFGKSTSLLPSQITEPVNGKEPTLGQMLPRIAKYLEENPQAAAPMNNPWLMDFYHSLLGAMMSGNIEQSFRIFPPDVGKEEVWLSPGEILQKGLEGDVEHANQVEELNQWGLIQMGTTDQESFRKAVEIFHQSTVKVATERGEYRFVPLEVSYHKQDYFYKALLCFVVSLLALALSWTSPAGKFGKICKGITWVTVLVGLVYGIVGIVIRCVIMQRPPITTLYETILFITTTGVLLAVIAEWLTKKGIGLTTAVFAGVIGMFLSIRYMNMEGTDTMQQLQAVLITNFWLATHVPIINLGYTAGMISSIVSMIYVFRRAFGLTQRGDASAKDLTRIAYGFVMGGLFLSLVGTILGGIWANYSWGRFWGWDPKENGALLIVLINLIILHVRLGGYVREAGFHALSIVLGMIVIFSWFGTNQLGVGLHAYGFTDGVWGWLTLTWGFCCIFLFGSIIFGLKDRAANKAA